MESPISSNASTTVDEIHFRRLLYEKHIKGKNVVSKLSDILTERARVISSELSNKPALSVYHIISTKGNDRPLWPIFEENLPLLRDFIHRY